MTNQRSNDRLKAQICAITFQGNASNKLQQDALFFNNQCIQRKNAISDVVVFKHEFCVAVADGVADSRLSQYASKALTRSVQKSWQNYLADDTGLKPIMTMRGIQQSIPQKYHQYMGANSTLAMLYKLKNKADKSTNEIVIKHVGDSRIYKQSVTSENTHEWHFITRDHNLLNDMLDEKAKAQGKRVAMAEYNQKGMAGSMYMLTESFVLGFALEFDIDDEGCAIPRHESNVIPITKGDCFVVCTDGIHDLVPSEQWQQITPETDLTAWLENLKKQVYASSGKAYDNGTAIVIRFE